MQLARRLRQRLASSAPCCRAASRQSLIHRDHPQREENRGSMLREHPPTRPTGWATTADSLFLQRLCNVPCRHVWRVCAYQPDQPLLSLLRLLLGYLLPWRCLRCAAARRPHSHRQHRRQARCGARHLERWLADPARGEGTRRTVKGKPQTASATRSHATSWPCAAQPHTALLAP